MSTVSLFRVCVPVALAAFGVFGSASVRAACCPGEGHGAPKAASGLGESNPVADDLSADPAWQVYEFERGGIQYVQVNDQYGVVRAAVGRIEDTYWVLPVGKDAERVSIPGDASPVGMSKILYRSEDVEVLLLQVGEETRWVIRSPVMSQ